MELEVLVLQTLRAHAKAGHMNNRERLITALKYEILNWEGVH
jgi:hypothetical protein